MEGEKLCFIIEEIRYDSDFVILGQLGFDKKMKVPVSPKYDTSRGFPLCRITTSNKISLMEFSYNTSYKMDLDLWDCIGRKKKTSEPLSYK